MRPFTKLTKRSITLVAAVVVPLLAFGALAHDKHHAIERPAATADAPQAADYLAWHRQEASMVELDTLTESLRLFSTVSDVLATDPDTAWRSLVAERDEMPQAAPAELR